MSNNQVKDSKIYEKICVSNSEIPDIYEMVAYGIYKKKKREFIANRKKTNNNKNLTLKELENFEATCEGHIEEYREQSVRLVSALINNIIDEKLPEIENSILKDINRPSMGKDILTNFVASFLWSLFLALTYFIVSDYTFQDIGKKYFNKPEIEKNIIDTTHNKR